jgi:hypothetical protein
MTYSRDDGASQEVVDQRELVDMMYDLRNGGGNAYSRYQTELMVLDRLTGGKG